MSDNIKESIFEALYQFSEYLKQKKMTPFSIIVCLLLALAIIRIGFALSKKASISVLTSFLMLICFWFVFVFIWRDNQISFLKVNYENGVKAGLDSNIEKHYKPFYIKDTLYIKIKQ